jgi:dynein heavy chain, axonemal
MQSNQELNELKKKLMDRVKLILTKANTFKDSFNKYAYLWVDDRIQFMKQFLQITSDDILIVAMKLTSFNHKNESLLDKFKEQVDTYEKIYEDVYKLDDVCLFDKWFRIDIKPFKVILLNTVKKWSYMFKHYLLDDVTDRLIFFILLLFFLKKK